MSGIAERLRALRDQLGYSQEGIAASVGMKQRTWADWERNPPQALEDIRRVAQRYNTTTDYLLGLTDDPSPRRDAPLPEVVRDVIEIMLGLSEGRRAELLAHARVLDEAELEADLDAYDRMMAVLLALPDGEQVAAVVEEALRAGATGDVAAADRMIEALIASRAAKDAVQKPAQ